MLHGLERRYTHMHCGGRLAGAPPCAPRGRRPPMQRRSMRMIHPGPPFLVDLPVDVVVVLEQQEGTDEAKRTERSLP